MEPSNVRKGTLAVWLTNTAQVKPTMFSNPPPDHVFGYTLPGDLEHAREGEEA